jgi:hypothetical protein
MVAAVRMAAVVRTAAGVRIAVAEARIAAAEEAAPTVVVEEAAHMVAGVVLTKQFFTKSPHEFSVRAFFFVMRDFKMHSLFHLRV